MPIGKNLTKIQKKVEKSGKDAALHPRSLKLKQLNRATLRKERLAKQKATRQSLRSVEGELDSLHKKYLDCLTDKHQP